MDFQTLSRLIQANDLSFFKSVPATSSSCILKIQSKYGDSALHLACREDRVHILEVLSNFHKVDLESSNHEGKKAIHEASQYGAIECLRYLLNRGVQVDALKRADWTPLMLACTKKSIAVVEALLDAGANPSFVNKDGWNAFHIASREGDVAILKILLKNSSSIWDTKSKNLRTPLHTAALHGHKDAVSWLLERCHYNVDDADSCGVTPLVDALRSGHTDIASELVFKYKTDVYLQDKVGGQPIHNVAQSGQLESMEFLLLTVKVPVNTVSETILGTALHAAAKEGQEAMLQLLINRGANIDTTDRMGRTALHIASGAQSVSCVKCLLHHGATMLPDFNGKMPFDLAVKQNVKDVFESSG